MSGRERMTLDDARRMEPMALIEKGYRVLAQYEKPVDPETEAEREERIDRTLDEVPDLYAWFLQLHAYFDHWAVHYYDNESGLHGPKSIEYKDARQKRDAMENLARAAKLRYEGTSRLVTQFQRHESEAALPRHRR